MVRGSSLGHKEGHLGEKPVECLHLCLGDGFSLEEMDLPEGLWLVSGFLERVIYGIYFYGGLRAEAC